MESLIDHSEFHYPSSKISYLLFPTGGRGGTLASGMDGLQRRIQNHRATDEGMEQVQGRAGHDQVYLHGLLVQPVSQTDRQSQN